MKGKAGSGKLTKPTQPKAPEDNYQKGSKFKNKQVAFEDEVEADDESEEETPTPARIGPPSSRKIRELPYVDVPSLTPVVRADRPRPKENDGPAYTTRAPIEKEELGQEVLEEMLNASLDVMVRQLLGTAPTIRKELMKQLAKVRQAPTKESNRAQYKATVEDVTDEDEPKRHSPLKKPEIERVNKIVKGNMAKGLVPETKNSSYRDRTLDIAGLKYDSLVGLEEEIPEEEIKRISKIIEEKIASGNYEPKNSSYKRVVWEDILNKKGLREHSEGENFECPELEETIDVATLPLARSTTVLSENGKKRVITMGDPVVQYLSSLPKGENPKTFYMKESSLALRSIYPLVNNARQEEALLDSGSQIVSMSKDAAVSLKMSWNPDISINMQSAQGHVEPTLGLATDVPFTFGDLTVMLQVHIINKPSYKILLGRPFDALTRSTIQNERDGSQMVTITDPASDHRIVLPTYPRNQGPPRAVKENSESFQ
jgi:hypothetical protein